MVPFRKLHPLYEETPPSSGPSTLRSARFEAAAPLAAPTESASRPSEAPCSSDDYMPILERSDIIQAVRPRQVPSNEVEPEELLDEDLEILFDEDPIFDLGEPDTERTIYIDDFDTEPPPPTLRCPGS